MKFSQLTSLEDIHYKETFQEAAAIIIECKNKTKQNSRVAFLRCDPGWCVHILYRRCSLTSRINGMTKTYGEQRRLYS